MTTLLEWTLKILALIPTIIGQAHTIIADLPSKQSAAQDSLAAATADLSDVLPAEDVPVAQAIAGVASSTINSTIEALHPSSPAVQAGS